MRISVPKSGFPDDVDRAKDIAAGSVATCDAASVSP